MDIINARINNPSLDEVVYQPHLYPLRWISRRELTGKLHGPSCIDMAGESYSKASFYKGLYHSFGHSSTWNNASGNPYQYGAVFNFDFSPDGSTLAAASERRSILLFDPLTHKMHKAKTNAHTDCVNIVRYIDNRLFATCSDDGTVKLWDQRNLDKEIHILKGHSHWIKNIESVNGKLLTSGFDGNIILWDSDRYTENGDVSHQILFTTRNLMRTALSQDKSKLVISTSSGYVIVVHDLDLNTLATDLDGFKPNIYRLMQMNPTAGNGTIPFSHLFNENRPNNRLEMIADFVDDVDVEIIASLKLHPSGNFMVSRNTSSDEQHEHTCIHDLRNIPTRNSPRLDTEDSSQSSLPSTSASTSTQYLLSMAVGNSQAGPIDLSMHSRRTPQTDNGFSDRSRDRSRSPLRDEVPSTSRNGFRPTNLGPTQSEMLSRVLPSAQQRLDNLAANYASNNDQFMIFIQGGRDGVHQTLVLFGDDKRNPGKPTKNPKNGKLLWYVEEPNMGRGFIKEPCFSHDGRIVCSPFAHGVRLLGVDSDCSELEDKLTEGTPKKAMQLQEIASVYSHQNLVVAANFSPTHHLLVTGCLDGQVCFHQPLL